MHVHALKCCFSKSNGFDISLFTFQNLKLGHVELIKILF